MNVRPPSTTRKGRLARVARRLMIRHGLGADGHPTEQELEDEFELYLRDDELTDRIDESHRHPFNRMTELIQERFEVRQQIKQREAEDVA